MGVLGLWQLLAPVGQPVTLESLENKILAVDISIWLNQALKGYRDGQGGSVPNAHLLSLYSRLCKLLFYKIRPIIVFDGGYPEIKKQTIINRQQRRAAIKQSNRDLGTKILTNYLATQNLAKATGSDYKTLKTTTPKKQVRDEIFILPPMPEQTHDDGYESSKADLNERKFSEFSKEDLKYLNKIDINSEDFTSLPIDVQQEILSTLKETRKLRTWEQFEDLPKESNDFSKYQMQCLLKRRNVQQKLEQVQKDLRTMSSTDFISQYTNDHIVGEANKIMSDDTSHYVLLKKIVQKQTQNSTETVTSDDILNSSMVDTKNVFIKDMENIDIDTIEDDDIDATESSEKVSVKTEEYISEDEDIIDDPPTAGTSITSNLKSTYSLSNRTVTSSKNIEVSEHFPVLPIHDEENESVDECSTPSKFSSSSIHSNSKVSQETTEKMKLIAPNYDSVVHASNDSEKCDFSPFDETPTIAILDSETFAKVTPAKDTAISSLQVQQDAIIMAEATKVSLDISAEDIAISKSVFESNTDLSVVEDADIFVEEDFTSRSTLDSMGDASSNKNVKLADIPRSDDEFKSSEKGIATNSAKEAISKNALEESSLNINADFIMMSESSDEDESVENIARNLQFQEDLEVATSLLEADRAKQERQNRTVQEHMVEECKELLRLFGIPYVVSPTEAEAQCAFYDVAGLTHGTITDDSDVFLFGGKRVYKNFFAQQKYVELYKDSEIFAHFGMSRLKLINFALLTGSDYTEGIDGVGPVTAMEILSEFPADDLDSLKAFRDWWKAANSQSSPPKNKIRAKLRKLVIMDTFPDEKVPVAYLNPTIDKSTEKFTWGRPDLDSLRDYSKERFGWNKTKVDDSLLPVIKKLGERDNQTHLDSFFTVSLKKQTNLFPSKRIMSALKKMTSEQKVEEDDDCGLKPTKRKARSTKRTVRKKVNMIITSNKCRNGPALSEESSDES